MNLLNGFQKKVIRVAHGDGNIHFIDIQEEIALIDLMFGGG